MLRSTTHRLYVGIYLAIFATTFLLVGIDSVCGQGFPPPGGGGGGGQGNGSFDPLDDITINSITVTGNTGTVNYTLHDDYNETIQPYLTATNPGGATDTFNLNDKVIGTYSKEFNLQQTEGAFHVFIAYPLPPPDDEFKGVGQSFEVEGGVVTIINTYVVFLGLSPLNFSPIGNFCATCDDTVDRGTTLPKPVILNDAIFRIPLLQVDSGGNGCSTCGGSGSGTSCEISTELLVQPQNGAIGGSAGPGVFHKDIFETFVVAANEDGTNVSVRIYMPHMGKAITLRDDYDAATDTYTGTIDGILEGEYAIFNEVELVNSGGSAVTKMELATGLNLTKIDGTQLIMQLWDIQEPGGDDDQDLDAYARLKSRKNRWDVAEITCSYPSGTTGFPSSITDRYGNTATFEFNAEVAGRKAMSKITFNGQSTTIGYGSDFIGSVSYPVGGSWSFTLSHDSVSQTEKLAVVSPCDGTKNYRLTEDFMIFNNELINQPVNVLRSISNSLDNNLMSIFFNPSDSAEARIWTAGDRLALYHNDEFAHYIRHYTSWTLGDINDGWDAFTNLSLEGNYASLGYPPITGGTNQELAYGAATTVTTATGEVITCSFGPAYHVTMQEYDDGSYETWQYDAYYNVTRHRNRNGNVTKYVYFNGSLLEQQVGIIDTGTKTTPNDVNQPEYAVYKYAYHNDDTKKYHGLLKTEFSARWTTEADLYRTDYEYDLTTGRLLRVIESADVASGARATTEFTYGSGCSIATSDDPLDRQTEFFYDAWGRNYKTEYHDGSTEITYYGGAGQECQVVKQRARDGVTTKTEYDVEGRVKKVIRGYSTINSLGAETVNTNVLTQSVTEYFYDGDSNQIDYQISDGKKTSYVYDYKYRTTEVKTNPYTGKTLTSKTVYGGNRVYYTEDPYGRKSYNGYSASNSTELIRKIQCTKPSQSFGDNAAILNATRDLNPNAAYIIADAIKDAEGNLLEVIDGRNISTKYVHDSRERETEHKDAEGTAIEAKTETDYDKDSNVSEVRGPRYFDSADTDGYNKAKTNSTYNGRGMRSSTTEAPGTAVAATASMTYFLDGRVDKMTDGRGNDWFSYWHSCCGRPQGNKDPAGHGSITNNDYTGRVTHTAVVSDYASHTNLHNPTDAKTLAESTTSYDILGRPVASTHWLVARGTVDENDPPIAGLGGVAAADGITTQTIFDNDLKDNVGLDNTTGVSVDKLGGGTFNVSLDNAITKLGDTVANGGAGITFTADVSAGSAVVTINAEEEISFSISDATGRTVIRGQIQSHADTSPNTLIVHRCMKYDTEVTITGWGDVLETWSIDANGEVTKSRSDGGSRTLETEDQDTNVSSANYDAKGNVVESRDPNGIGFDIVYDDLDRPISRTDTWGDLTQTSYYLGGMVYRQTDDKGKFSDIAYDARGRWKTVTNRQSKNINFTYDKNNNLLSISDAQSKVTSYTYNSRNLKDKETYPDHTGGNPGDTGYGIVQFSHDDMGRVDLKTDQLGDTVTFNYDLAGRITQRDYRLKVNSPTGTIADSDTFTFDKASRMLTAVSGRYSNTVTLTYDLAGRTDDESLTIGSKTYTVSREYNNLGQLSKLTYPDSSLVDRTYTDRGQLNLVKYKSTTVDTRTYDVGGRMSTSTYSNGVVSTLNYRSSGGNKDNLIDSIVTTNTGTEKVGTYTYSYDANKNKTKETITNSSLSTKSFDTTLGTDPDGYDDDDRLTYWERSDSNRKLEWTLTDVGDWSALKLNGTSTSRTHNDVHEVTAIGASAITYDVKGNLLVNNTLNDAYTWDFDNRLKDIDVGNNSSVDHVAKYDALGRRVQFGSTSSPNTYVYAGQQLISRYENNGAASSPKLKWVYGSYIDEPIMMDREVSSTWSQYFYSRNHQYSITAITDSGGNIVERYVYDAYGNTTIYAPDGTTTRSTSSYNNNFMYTGRYYHDDLKIYYFRARMYDSELGRFISRDPLGYVDGSSLYRGYFSVNGVDWRGTLVEENLSEWHHLFNQSERDWFEAKGLKIDEAENGCLMAVSDHKAITSEWTKEWKQFRLDYPNATKKQMINKKNRMMSDPRFSPYLNRSPWAPCRYGYKKGEWRNKHLNKNQVFRLARKQMLLEIHTRKCATSKNKRHGKARVKLLSALALVNSTLGALAVAKGECDAELSQLIIHYGRLVTAIKAHNHRYTLDSCLSLVEGINAFGICARMEDTFIKVTGLIVCAHIAGGSVYK